MKAKITFICMFLACMSFAQEQSYRPADLVQFEQSIGTDFIKDQGILSLAENENTSLPPELTHYTLLSINSDLLAKTKSNQLKAINLTVPTNNRSAMTLELVRVDVKTPDFEIIEMPQGNILTSTFENVHYRGIIKDVPRSIAAVSFVNGEIMGLISRPDEAGNYVIGKLDNSDLHILYSDVDISDAESFSCESIDAQGEMRDYAKDVLFANEYSKSAGDCPRIYFDLATSFIATQGNNATTASNYVEGVFNQVATLYANENVNILNSGMTAWTSNQPFVTDLANYRNYRNSNSFNGDLGHLISTLGGGVAYINGLCNSYKYGESGLTGSYYTVPTYSWAVNLLAHELGHNFGSRHTHDCAWNGNNTAIDGCGPAAGYGSGCNASIPYSTGGTIMSYCHLTSAGVNLSLGFGSQPGNVIRNTVISSTCTSSCSSGGSGCAGAPQWQSGASYAIGDQVVYLDNLYEWTASGWIHLGACSVSNDPCANVQEWEPISYPIGSYVTYAGALYQWTASGWVYISDCGSTGGSYIAPPSNDVSISIYPNPTEGAVLEVKVNNGMLRSYRILNQLGQLVQGADTNLGAINVSGIREGSYLIEVTTVNGEQFIEKFVKK